MQRLQSCDGPWWRTNVLENPPYPTLKAGREGRLDIQECDSRPWCREEARPMHDTHGLEHALQHLTSSDKTPLRRVHCLLCPEG